MEIINREKEEGIFSSSSGASAVSASTVVVSTPAPLTKDAVALPETTRLPVPSLKDDLKDAFRTMTFNIRFDTEKDEQNRWCYRSHLVPATIRLHSAHIIGFQEALRTQIDDLERSLPEFGWVGVGRDDGKNGGEFCPIFWREDKFKCLDSGTFWLSETPSVAGSRGWGARCRRIATWARLITQDLKVAKEVFVLNAHFDHESDQARLESCLLVSRRIPQLIAESKKKIPSSVSSIPVIVMGDFNALENSETLQLLRGEVKRPEEAQGERIIFGDARLTSNQKYNEKSGTFTNWSPPSQEQKECILIDHILYHGDIKPELYGIICELWQGKRASDHRPMVVDFRFVSSSSS